MFNNIKTSDQDLKAVSIDRLVSKKLKMRRMILGLSQHDVGVAVSLSTQQIQKYEKAVNRISSGRLYNFAKVLKVPIGYFFTSAESFAVLNASFAEEPTEYIVDYTKDILSTKDTLVMFKAFVNIRDPQVRRRIIELMKSITAAQ